jgi:hypothetical protein
VLYIGKATLFIDRVVDLKKSIQYTRSYEKAAKYNDFLTSKAEE